MRDEAGVLPASVFGSGPFGESCMSGRHRRLEDWNQE